MQCSRIGMLASSVRNFTSTIRGRPGFRVASRWRDPPTNKGHEPSSMVLLFSSTPKCERRVKHGHLDRPVPLPPPAHSADERHGARDLYPTVKLTCLSAPCRGQLNLVMEGASSASGQGGCLTGTIHSHEYYQTCQNLLVRGRDIL